MARFSVKENVRELLVATRGRYEKLPTSEAIYNRGRNSWANRLQRPRMSLTRMIAVTLVTVFIISLTGTVTYKKHHRHDGGPAPEKKQYHWEHYDR